MEWGELQTELGYLLPDEFDLLLVVPWFVVFRTFVDVFGFVLAGHTLAFDRPAEPADEPWR